VSRVLTSATPFFISIYIYKISMNENLIKYFYENSCIKLPKQNKKIKSIFEKLYIQIYEGIKNIRILKKSNPSYYNLEINEINNVSNIPKPKTFAANAFPSNIINYINNKALYYLSYNINIYGRNIQILFVLENKVTSNIVKRYNAYVDWICVWLYIANNYAKDVKCSSKLTLYIYHISLLKELPRTNIDILGQNNVNTAFTRSCVKNAEIVIFRKEEWFKVLIHETFHSFGLDFSDMDNDILHNNILNIFPVNSEVNLYEAYTEFWARMMNILFCSYIHNTNKNDIKQFIKNTEGFLDLEIKYSYFQMVKILNFMGLDYNTLYEKTDNAHNARMNLYKEESSILSYYVITTLLLNNYQEFIIWCQTNNNNLLQFNKNKNKNTQFELYEFINKKHKTKRMLENAKCSKNLLVKYNKKYNSNSSNKEMHYLLSNLRMSLCEL
jgi:hypothetical protein